MKLFRSLSPILLLSLLTSVSCSKETVKPSSSTGALTANSAIESLVPRPFDREALAVSGMHSLNEFIRSDVRGRLDEESTGDTQGIYEAPSDASTASTDEAGSDGKETPVEEPQQQELNEDTSTTAVSREAKFHWVKKSFGDAVKANPGNSGVIVLYADENLYDIHALMRFVEEGRSRIAAKSELGEDRFAVVYGGYRAVAQVETWVIPPGGTMPAFKPDDRAKSSEPEN